MKNTSFERVWTKTSVKRILKQYLECDECHNTYLCNVCPEFKSLWDNEEYRREIHALAKDAQITTSISRDAFAGSCALFNYPFEPTQRKLRINFLNHEIARLSKK